MQETNQKKTENPRVFETDLLFGEKYQDKTENGSHFLQCVFCGRDTSKQGKSDGVLVGGGAALIVHPEDYPLNDGGDMGWFPIGSECIKSVPTEYRVSNPYKNKVRGVN